MRAPLAQEATGFALALEGRTAQIVEGDDEGAILSEGESDRISTAAGADVALASTKRPEFQAADVYATRANGYRLLPFRFARIPDVPGQVLLTSDLGDFLFVDTPTFDLFRRHALPADHPVYADLSARGILLERDRPLQLGLRAAAYRTRKAYLFEGQALHIFVVTLRCDHSCPYCQVSRASAYASAFDMSLETANAAVERLFESPSPHLTVEFQGGEPALAMQLVHYIVDRIEARNATASRHINFTMVSTLHHLGADDLHYLRDHGFHLSTSIDGPAALHDRNRPNPTRDSWARTVDGVARVRSILGDDSVAALTTITRACLEAISLLPSSSAR